MFNGSVHYIISIREQCDEIASEEKLVRRRFIFI